MTMKLGFDETSKNRRTLINDDSCYGNLWMTMW